MRVITLGTFDIMHYGHIKLFRRCKELGDYLTVAINTDEFVESYKGKRPIMNYMERYTAIMETGLTDQVVPNCQKKKGDSCFPVINGHDLIVIGQDWGVSGNYIEQIGMSWDLMDRHQISLAYVPYTRSISTTEIKKRCRQ